MKVVKYTGGTDSQSQLSDKLYKAAVAYYGGQTPLMTDYEFDHELEELQKMERVNGFAYDISPSIMVGATIVDELRKMRHETPALSLDKVKYDNRESLVSWLHDQSGVLSWKMDGLTVVVTYKNGKLFKAVTRGNGYEGSDITHNAAYFEGLPVKIPFKYPLVIRGECVMTFEEFERVNDEADGVYENPRNLASATIQLLDSRESRKRQIIFYAFEVVTPTDIVSNIQSRRLNDLAIMGFNVVDFTIVTPDTILDEIETFKNKVNENIFPSDGLVLTYEDQKYAASLGSTGHHPRGSIAMKWTDETVSSVVRKIDWSVGKTGVITPVAVFDTVRLGVGSNVSRASLHNLSVMQRLDVGIGSNVEVYLANMIIPQIAYATHGDVHIPETCPICGGNVEIRNNNDVLTLNCINDNCPAKKIKNISTFVSKNGLNIKGLSEEKIKDLINFGYIANAYDLYSLRSMDSKSLKRLESKDGWGKKSVKNLLAAIEKSKNTDLQHFIYAFSIPLCGNELSKVIANAFNNDILDFIDFVEHPNTSYLEGISGIGEVKANNFINWCKSCDVNSLKWLVSELKFKTNDISDSDGIDLTGLTFVITGIVHHFKNRDEFKEYVERHGGKVAGSVSSKTDYLVNNNATSLSSKNKQAKELGIPIITEEQFLEVGA